MSKIYKILGHRQDKTVIPAIKGNKLILQFPKFTSWIEFAGFSAVTGKTNRPQQSS